MEQPFEWRPRPDPAVHDPGRPGLRPHCHPPNRLHAWVFLQHQVWVDYWGNEHEIGSIPADYIANIIGFCEERVERICFLISIELILDAAVAVFGLSQYGDTTLAQQLSAIAPPKPTDDRCEWLHTLPLMRTLDQRAEQLRHPERQ